MKSENSHKRNSVRYDIAIIGAGPSGLMAAYAARTSKKKVVLFEAMPTPGLKLLASGGKRCNLTNTLDRDDFIACFGRQGRFIGPALDAFDNQALRDFFTQLGVETHAPDGYRVWPVTHRARTVCDALVKAVADVGVELLTGVKVKTLAFNSGDFTLQVGEDEFIAAKVIVATGGLSYPALGGSGDGYFFAKKFGHAITKLYPAGVELWTRETWTRKCTSDTVGKAELQVNLPKHRHIKGKGDLIFTSKGLSGPLILDLARELTPLLDKYGELPVVVNLGNGRNFEAWRAFFNESRQTGRHEADLVTLFAGRLPESISKAFCELIGISPDQSLMQLSGEKRELLLQMISRTPLTIYASAGFNHAIVTTGGVSLKSVESRTLESKLQPGLFFCGECLDLDGPCGGFNLQWAFSSGYLAGAQAARRANDRGI